MSWYAIHDSAGDVSALVVGPVEAPAVSVGLGPGQFVTEIEAPRADVVLDTENLEAEQYLIEMVKSSRVAAGGIGRLEPR
jgi:hypothetical protein